MLHILLNLLILMKIKAGGGISPDPLSISSGPSTNQCAASLHHPRRPGGDDRSSSATERRMNFPTLKRLDMLSFNAIIFS